YWRQLDEELRAAGFTDQGFPDGRVLRICLNEPNVTVARVGRELGITRQGAGKIVASLRERGYVALTPSPEDAREKIVTLTDRATDFLAARRKAVQKIDRQLRKEAGDDAFDGLQRILAALGGDSHSRMTDYLPFIRDLAVLIDPDE
ncbi:MAG: MarR family transcriptional regulator, partial [Acidimicrobiaceae bacterium]|nr:MarR family transcriptional regulator [Acidimicrobiaceae bacterium]